MTSYPIAMNSRRQVWIGLVMLLAGFCLRERAHAMAAQSWIAETVARMASPHGPPACVYDCTRVLSGDAAILGWVSIALMVSGTSLLVWSSLKRSRA